MSLNKKHYTPIEIILKIEPNFLEQMNEYILKESDGDFDIDQDMRLILREENKKALYSKINLYLYFVCSILEGKNVYYKDSQKFYFSDFSTNYKDLLIILKLFHSSNLLRNNIFNLSISKDLRAWDLTKLKELKLFFNILGKINFNLNDDIKEALEQLIKADIKDYYELSHSFYNQTLLLNDFFKKIFINFENYIKNFKEKDKYEYIIDKKIYNYPKNIFLTELEKIENHITAVSNKEIAKKFNKLFLDKVPFDNSGKYKKIIHELPSSSSSYDNLKSIINIISYLNYLEVNKETIKKLKFLKNDFPHFSEVIDYLCLYFNVNLKNNGVLNFKPILLLSKNGIGKSSFLRKLSNIFNLYNNFINYGSITTPSEISGLTPMWRTGNVGFIAQCINNNNVYNPIIILEELDKANKNHYNGNIFTPLFDLLEKRSASIFYENGLATNINFSYVNFIATANNLSEVNFGILNRFKIFEIEEPKDLDMFNIVNSIYKDYLEEDLFKNLTINEDGIRAISNACVLSNIKNVRAISKMIEDILIDGLNNLIDNNLESFEIDYLSDKYLMENKTLH